MIDQLRDVLLNHCSVVNCNLTVAVRVGCNELIRRKLNQLRNKLLDLRHVIDSDPAVSVRVADEELARKLDEKRAKDAEGVLAKNAEVEAEFNK